MNRLVAVALGGIGLGVLLSFPFAFAVDWLPVQGSTEATRIDPLIYTINAVSFGIFGLCTAILGYAIFTFRRKGPDDDRDGDPTHGHTGLEIFWTAIPTLIVIIFGVWGGIVLSNNEANSGEFKRVAAIGQQYSWSFEYLDEGGFTSGELVLPIDRKTEIVTRAIDVIHSFYVPEWRVKQDAVPGMDNRTWATPTKLGTFQVFCTELCGPGHAGMSFVNTARVVTQAEYDTWVAEQVAKQKEQDAAAADNPGLAVFTSAGCSGCHALKLAGSKGGVGPALDDLASAAQAAGEQPADFVRESIVDPNKQIAEGFAPNVMPGTYADRLKPEEIDQLVELLAGGSK